VEYNENIKPGFQVAYIPRHANGDIKHKDVEFGFITSMNSTLMSAFCRYWNKDFSKGLRTTSCSELTDPELLIPYNSHPQFEVDYLLEKINAGIDLD
jgi:hypothetical protein